jgi:hypothetical protein
MEELVKMLVDDGALEVADARWRFVPERFMSSTSRIR